MKTAIAVAALASVLAGCASKADTQANSDAKRIIVLGIDGMDPVFVENHWDALPNLERLRRQGTFQRLGTTMPPQSPVAWSTFTTGMPPDEHGIYDFIHRDPSNAMPISSMAETEPPDRVLSLGPYRIPLSEGKVVSHRRGRSFWEYLAEKGVPATILRMPMNFPPVECEAYALSGMGTPDLLGTFGTFSYFTDDPDVLQRKDVSGGVIKPVQLDNGRAELEIDGPDNTLRADQRRTSITMDVSVDPGNAAALFEVDGNRFVLRQGEWSGWKHVRFPLAGPLASAHGMIRVLAKQLKPRLEIYVSPVNLDPRQPDLPISLPASYSAELAERTSDYYTQGMPEDTSALRQGVLTREEYRQQSNLVSHEHLALLHEEIKRRKHGLLFFHFFGVDQDSHMLFGKYDDELLETYKLVDRNVGQVMEEAPDATLIVMSDHGFTTFQRAVNLNSWLMKEGFLKLTDPTKAGNQELFPYVDWSQTQAYALGLNGLYINLQGREGRGIVDPVERPRLLDEISKRLLEFRDPDTGAQIIDRVYRTDPENPSAAPDLLIGYRPPYRASWQTVLGAVPAALVEDNTDAWIADHCIEARFVPGVLIANRRTTVADPVLLDLPVTLLHEYGLPPGEGMSGRPILAPDGRQSSSE